MIKADIGHKLPREAPQPFAQAIVDVDAYRARNVAMKLEVMVIPVLGVDRAKRFDAGLD